MAVAKGKSIRYAKTGKFLRATRLGLGLTQRQVCRSIKISGSQCISNIERGLALPPLTKLRLIIAEYGVPYQKVVRIILEDEKVRLRSSLR